jgi:hypothetical protein
VRSVDCPLEWCCPPHKTATNSLPQRRCRDASRQARRPSALQFGTAGRPLETTRQTSWSGYRGEDVRKGAELQGEWLPYKYGPNRLRISARACPFSECQVNNRAGTMVRKTRTSICEGREPAQHHNSHGISQSGFRAFRGDPSLIVWPTWLERLEPLLSFGPAERKRVAAFGRTEP